MNSLQELTGQESGIVVYKNNDGILCNWASISGLPKVFITGVVGLGEEFPMKEKFWILKPSTLF